MAAKESIRRRKSSRRSIHGTLRAARGKGANEVADSFTRNDDYMDELDGEARTTETLRRMALPMHDKLSIKYDFLIKKMLKKIHISVHDKLKRYHNLYSYFPVLPVHTNCSV